MAEQQQWHVAIGLADFVAHVSNLQHVVDMCNTAELSSIDRAKLKNFMQWGSFIEEMMESLHSDSQRDALARALPCLSNQGASHAATLARLHQARAWVLGSILGSAFLGDHPKPEALLMWIMSEHQGILKPQGPADKQCGAFGTFVEDTADLVVAHGSLAVMSSAYSGLLVSADENEPGSFATASNSGGKSTRQRPCEYEMSVETAQKRAYARNCYDRILSEGTQRETGERATSIISEWAEVSRTDAIALEIMCLALLEPWRQTSHADPSLTAALLTQVLTFRDDAKLWSLDKWLLGELSHRYESFAEVYLNDLVYSRNGLNEVERKELDGDDLRGLRPAEDIRARLDVLSSRSERLKGLVAQFTGAI